MFSDSWNTHFDTPESTDITKNIPQQKEVIQDTSLVSLLYICDHYYYISPCCPSWPSLLIKEITSSMLFPDLSTA